MAKLVIKGIEGDREVTLEAANPIGRYPENRIQIHDALVSKNHCLIFRDSNGRYKIRDLKSLNGTFVNRQAIEQETLLEDGDEITLGMTSCLFVADERDERASAGDPQGTMLVFDRVCSTDIQQNKFLPEKEIQDEKALRADYEKLRVAVELQREIGLELNLNRIYSMILACTFELLVCDQAVILMADSDGNMKIEAFKARTGKDQLVVSSTVIKRVKEDKVGIISADAMTDERFQDAMSIVIRKVRSSMAVPILYKEELLGVMAIESSAAIMAYSEKDLLLFTNIAHQTANLIKMAEMAEKIRTEAITRERFQRLLSPDLAEMVVSGELKVEKGGEERVATVLFADIRGFTSMCENMEAADVLLLLNDYFEKMVEIAFKYEGTVDKFVGDMIMVVWGAPVSHPDDPERAVRAALDMQAALEKYNATGKRKIQVGIGINTDRLVAGYIGSTRTMSYSVVGDSVNVASRICSAAGPGEILISENTCQYVRGLFKVAESEPIQAKGKSQAINAYYVLGK